MEWSLGVHLSVLHPRYKRANSSHSHCSTLVLSLPSAMASCPLPWEVLCAEKTGVRLPRNGFVSGGGMQHGQHTGEAIVQQEHHWQGRSMAEWAHTA